MMSGGTGFARRTAFVTGGARRIGRAVALAFARSGANVVIHYHRSDRDAAAVLEEAGALGVQAWSVQADFADEKAVNALMSQVYELAGPVDILINNASLFPEDALKDFSLENLRLTANVNAYVPLLLSRHFAAQGRHGVIVNLLDARINDYDRSHVSYQLSKKMLATLTLLMAEEFAPTVRVNAVAPGLILPPVGKNDAYLQSLAHTNPLNAVGSADDVADAALFLARSPFITGQVIYVDGGRHMRTNVHD